MFIDKDQSKEVKNDYYPGEGKKRVGRTPWIFVSIIVFSSLAVVFGFFYFYAGKETPKKVVDKPKANNTAATSTSFLPSTINNPIDYNDRIFNLSDIEIEKVSFGDFYKKPEYNYDSNIKNYTLPLNVKADAMNYHDVARKIDMDPYVDGLNKNGFVLTDGLFKKTNSFYSTYAAIENQGIPTVVTSDFILYYYQNTIKQVFKNIEHSIFFENVWKINKKLYETQRAEFMLNRSSKGIVNDPYLEGQRRSAAYLAVILELLKPSKNQVSRNEKLINNKKFSLQEAEDYNYLLLDNYQKEVLNEVDLIKAAKKTAKSSILNYNVNYRKFRVPSEYSDNAKLTNFYLASKWMNSLFPLYFHDSECQNCFMDREDWIINMISAQIISKEIYENQNIQNDWAVIYKLISYFKGLRQDLTYIDYYEAFKGVAGDKSIEEFFSKKNPNLNDDIKKLQEKIGSKKFYNLEGAIDRSNLSNLPTVGMRVLQSGYWPNEYIFNKLTGRDLKIQKSADRKNVFTSCSIRNGQKPFRCRGVGEDVLGLVYPLKSKFYEDNKNFEGYEKNFDDLNKALNKFTISSWHNNFYWDNVYTIKTYLNDNEKNLFSYMKGDSWESKKINTALGYWVYIQLAPDKFIPSSASGAAELGYVNECNKYNYVEPDYDMIKLLRAKVDMLSRAFETLDVARKTNVVNEELADLDSNLEKLGAFIKKGLQNEKLSQKECEDLVEFSKKYTVLGAEKNTLKINGTDGATVENMKGVKIMLTVKEFEDGKVIAAGPVFDFMQKK